MNKLCLIFLGALLFALHFASQAQAQTPTTSSPKTTTMRNITVASNTTMSLHNTTTGNSTWDKNSGGRTELTVLLLPLALLYCWS